MRRSIALVVMCFASLGIISCATIPVVPGAVSNISATIPVVPTAVWDISANSADFRGPQPTGVLLLSSASTRNDAICQAFKGPDGLVDATTVSLENVRATYWLWKGAYQGADKTCGNLVANYDFDRAQRILADAGTKLDLPLTKSIGPVFVGFAGGDNGTAFLLDGSNIPSDKLPEFINNWKARIIQDQAVLAKAQQASASGAATATGNKIATKSGTDNNGFWGEFWDTIKPALTQLITAAVPILVAVIKGALHVA